MATVAPPRGDFYAFSNPFAQGAPVQPVVFSKGKGSSGQHHHLEQDDGLAINYEHLDDRPSYRPDVQLDRDQTAAPHHKRISDSPQTRMERVDSLFDVYAELYAADDASEQYVDEEEALGELQRGSSGWGAQPHVVPQSPLEEEEGEGAAEDDEPAQPWDERGKTGLYGGGGRGADDRETGWVSDYTFALLAPASGQEEDLRFDADEPDHGDTQQGRQFSSRSTQGFHPDDQPRRDSLETAPSSKGPATPPDVGSTATATPASARENVRPSHPSSSFSTPPIHTVDAARIKKSNLSPRIPTPSAPMQAGRVAGPLDRSARPRPKATGFKWPARAKKPPTISAPILPEGFVESLGMETFPLYPGAKVPHRASISASADKTRTSLREATSPNPQQQQQRAAPTRKAAPPVSRTPPRAVPAPAAEHERGSSTLVRAASTSPPPPRLDAVREEGDALSASETATVKRAQHERSASNMTAGSGFRDPWSAAPASVGSSSSVHSQQTRRVHRGSSYQGGSARASVASTVGGFDPRHFGSAAPVPVPHQYSPVDASSGSPGPTSPVMPGVRHDSLSSHYSEVSEAQEHPAILASSAAPSDAFRQDFTPFSTTAHLRGASAATLGSTTRGARPFTPTRPLNVHRRTSSTIHPGAGGSGDESKRSTLAGDVVWGGVGVGGPRDVSTPVQSSSGSPFARAASPFAQHAPTIGTTGFRNPFG
ncbi:hypothetical protein JCM3775_001230 [Rhodotorula graminis]|uniref:Uncharacterized protein n=1 Tax=Rhodotorula graminis (strain WP1) TaxID=578459 RepID=A0A194S4H3_RHOGW|nr:uncharacterized protein RHOBADRAFT_53454 [Rhodotorula graminis WP1]KPV75482.1 hypothetical protein RHOBADRAFT_53454 [Rhodotorula graminis WP1]